MDDLKNIKTIVCKDRDIIIGGNKFIHQTIFDIVRMTRDEQDANGNEHSASNGRFVSKGEGGADQGKN